MSMVTAMANNKDIKHPGEIQPGIDGLNVTPVDAELDALPVAAVEQEQSYPDELFEEDFLAKIRPDSRRYERIIAFCLIYAADRFDYTMGVDGLLQNLRDAYALEVAHNTFICAMVQGVITQHVELDERIKPFLKN